MAARNPHLMADRDWILDHLRELRGKNLACWCKAGTPCHADILLRLANVPHHLPRKAGGFDADTKGAA